MVSTFLCKEKSGMRIAYCVFSPKTERSKRVCTKSNQIKSNQIKSNQISLFLTQLQLQQNELKLNTQNAQLKAGKKI